MNYRVTVIPIHRDYIPQHIAARYDAATLMAYQRYAERKFGGRHPDGVLDSTGCWYPSADEEGPCCARVPRPSRAWPDSLWLHYHTARHVAVLHGVDPHRLRSLIAALAAYRRRAGMVRDPATDCAVRGLWECAPAPADEAPEG